MPQQPSEKSGVDEFNISTVFAGKTNHIFHLHVEAGTQKSYTTQLALIPIRENVEFDDIAFLLSVRILTNCDNEY